MIKAIFTTNNAWDSIYLTNGTFITVTAEIFNDFATAENEQDDFSNWDGNENWLEGAEDIKKAVEMSGDKIVAHYEDGKLIIKDKEKWEERKNFYL